MWKSIKTKILSALALAQVDTGRMAQIYYGPPTNPMVPEPPVTPGMIMRLLLPFLIVIAFVIGVIVRLRKPKK